MPSTDLNADADEAMWAAALDAFSANVFKGKGKAARNHGTFIATLARPYDIVTNTRLSGKRKHDDKQARILSQTPKKLKTTHEEEQQTKQTSSGDATKDAQHVDARDPKYTVNRSQNLQDFMDHIGMHREDPDRSTMVVRLPEQNQSRVLTASVASTGRIIMHDTAIPHTQIKARVQMGQPVKTENRAYLKPGKHGRRGDFDDDPNRRTGKGHQIDPADQEKMREYRQFRDTVLLRYPTFPRVDAEEKIHPDLKRGWEHNEDIRHRFEEKYFGKFVAHLWNCGCEKLRGESEDEESEEE